MTTEDPSAVQCDESCPSAFSAQEGACECLLQLDSMHESSCNPEEFIPPGCEDDSCFEATYYHCVLGNRYTFT